MAAMGQARRLFSSRSVWVMLLGLTVLIQQGRECRAATTSDLPATSAYLDCLTDNIGDGSCDEMNNVAACDYDDGDCCLCTCVDGVFPCGGSYDCIDPTAACVDDDDGSGGVANTAPIEDDDVTSSAVEEADSSSNEGNGTHRITATSAAGPAITAAAGAAMLLMALVTV